MSHAATSVNVVTTDGPGGRAGITVSAMSSVSADTPQPSLLVCVHHESKASKAIIANGRFCVNLLRDDQTYISDVFAGRLKTHDGDRFSATEWVVQRSGTPRVKDPLVAFDCRLDQHMQVGTHHVLFGAVEDIFIAKSGLALIYANRAYGSPLQLLSAPPAAGERRSAHRLKLGCFQTFGPYLVPGLVAELQGRLGPVDLHLVEGDQRRILDSLRSGEIELALLYDFDLDDEVDAEPIALLHPYALLAASDPLASLSRLTLADLATQPMVLLDMPPSRDYFLSLFRAAGLEPQVAFRSTSFEMVRGLVGHGLGYSLLATKPANTMSYDGKALVCRDLADSLPPSRLVLARRRDKPATPAAQAFAEICCKAILT